MSNITGGSVVWNFDADTSKFEAGLSKAKAQTSEFGSTLNKISFKDVAGSASSAFGSIADGIANVVKKVALLSVGAGGLGTVFLKSAGDLQQTSKSMEVLTGNTEVANKLFAQLAKYANETPFEFPDIAKAGKTLLGFGISVDKVFPNVQMLGDIAAATGADFGSLATVFGQVNATGKLMGQDALQLINNNIPITTILAKKLGISVQEVKARMEDGAISADLFNDALLGVTKEGGFAFKGTDVLAQSLNGRLSTLKDAALEAGRNLLGMKVDPKLGLVIEPGGLFQRLSDLLPKITAQLAALGPKLQGVFEWIFDNGDTVKAIIAAIAVAFIAAKVAAIGFAIAAAANPVTLIAAGIVALIAGLTYLQVKFDIFGKAIKFLQPVIDIFKSVLGDLWKSIKELADVLGKELAPVFEFVSKHADVFKKIGIALLAVVLAPLILTVGLIIASIKILAVVLGFIADHFDVIKKVVMITMAVALAPLILLIGAIVLIVRNFGTAMRWLGSVFTEIGQAIWTAITFVYNIIVTVFTAIWNFISPILNFIKNLFIIVFGGILIVILTVLNAIFGIFQSVWNAIWAFLAPIIQAIVGFLAERWENLKNNTIMVFNALKDFFTSIWNTIYGVISGIVQRIIDFFAPAVTWLFEKGKAIIQGLINGIKNLASGVWNAIKGVADQIGQFFSGVGSWLFDSGKALFQGLIDGMKNIAGKVQETAKGIVKKVRDLLPFSPAKEGPFSGSGWTLYSGQALMEGFAQGIKSGAGSVNDVMGSVLGDVQANVGMTVAPSIADMPMTGGGTRIENQIGTINIASEVDGENWLQKLTRNDEVTRAGLTS